MKLAKLRRIVTVLLLLHLPALLACGAPPTEPGTDAAPPETDLSAVTFESGTVPVTCTELALPLAPGETALLSQLPDLAHADLTGSADTAEILAFAGAHPEIAVTCNVDVLGQTVPYDAAAVTATGGWSLQEILSAMRTLPNLQKIDLSACAPDNASLTAIRQAYPDIAVLAPVTLFGKTLDSELTALSVTAEEAAGTDVFNTLAEALPLLPEVTSVDLTALTGTLLPETILSLQQQFPAVTFLYTFRLFNRELHTTDTSVDLFKVRVKNDGVPALAEALACMPACTYADMALTGVDDEAMAALAAEFPQIRFSWMVSFGKYRCRTDANMLKASVPEKAFSSDDAQVLRYCTQLTHVDIGHNALTDLSFLSDMRDMTVLIAAISHHVTDITPLAGLNKLEYLELFTNRITDLTPLAGLTELRHLNLCNNRITDASPLYNLTNLERLWISMNPLSDEQKEKLVEALPNCEINFTATDPTGDGWRKHPRYDLLSEQFLYGSGTIFLRFDMAEPR